MNASPSNPADELPRALIVSPYVLSDFADQTPFQSTVHQTRLFNLREYLSASDKHWITTTELSDKTGINLLVLVGRKGCTAKRLEDEAQAALAFHKGALRKALDWADIDDLVEDPASATPSELDDGTWPPSTWRELASTPITGPTPLGQQAVEFVLDRAGVDLRRRPGKRSHRTPPLDARGLIAPESTWLPVALSWGDHSTRVLSVANGQLRDDAIDRADIQVATDRPKISWVVAADGTVAVTLRGRRITAYWLTAVSGQWRRTLAAEADLPDAGLSNPRVVAVSRLSHDTLRLLIGDDYGAVRMFVTPEGHGTTERLMGIEASIRLAIQVHSDTLLVADGGSIEPSNMQSSIFDGISSITAMDASYAGGVGLAVAVGTAGRRPTLVASEQRDGGRWKPINVSKRLEVLGINPAAVTAIGVERRLDESEPACVVLAVGQGVEARVIQLLPDEGQWRSKASRKW